MLSLKIWWYKRKAKKAYMRYLDVLARTGSNSQSWMLYGYELQEYDRDINTALNIAAAGHRRLAEGITVF